MTRTEPEPAGGPWTSQARPPEAAPAQVVVVGGGVAGLETLMALRDLAPERVQLTLVAPHDEFVYRPVAADPPFGLGSARRIGLYDVARAADAAFVNAAIESVDPDARIARPAGSHPLDYDALVLAVGARAVPAIERALMWDDRSAPALLGGLLEDIEEGYSRRLAIVIPPGVGWPLRGYELALWIAREAKGMSAELETTIVVPEPSPLQIFGSRAVDEVSSELEQAGVQIMSAASAEVTPGHAATVVMRPSGRRLEVDRVLALPALKGRRIAGIPADAAGFVEVDGHCRVRAVDRVWAAGDVTSCSLKSGGVAVEQAGVVAGDIAARAGADVAPRAFDPEPLEDLAGPPGGRFLNAWLGADEDARLTRPGAGGLPMLAFLQRDLKANWRGQS